MLKKTIKYKDFNDVERTEDFYFNLTRAEIAEMELTTEGGLAEKIDKIVKAQSVPEIIAIFKDLILRAYGKKSDDGRQFKKSLEIRDEFASTEAYSILFMELATNAEAATKFVNGIIPADAVKAVPSPGNAG